MQRQNKIVTLTVTGIDFGLIRKGVETQTKSSDSLLGALIFWKKKVVTYAAEEWIRVGFKRDSKMWEFIKMNLRISIESKRLDSALDEHSCTYKNTCFHCEIGQFTNGKVWSYLIVHRAKSVEGFLVQKEHFIIY